MLRRRLSGFLVCVLGPACQGDPGAGAVAPATGGLPTGVAALVGPTEVSVEAVRAVATGEATTPVEARRRLVADALFAAEGAQRFAGTGLVDSARRAALARVLLERVRNDVAAGEPPTEDEWRDALAGRWVEFDRPAAVLTRHAIVRFKEGRDREAARPVAERIASAVSGAESAEEFMERANAVDGGEFEILVQSLPSVTADGRTFYLDHSGKPVRAAGYFDPNFAAAANAIEEEGTMSPVTESKMGLHIIYLVRRIPGETVPEEERRRRVVPEIQRDRAQAIVQQILAEQAELHPVVVSRMADALTADIKVAGP